MICYFTTWPITMKAISTGKDIFPPQQNWTLAAITDSVIPKENLNQHETKYTYILSEPQIGNLSPRETTSSFLTEHSPGKFQWKHNINQTHVSIQWMTMKLVIFQFSCQMGNANISRYPYSLKHYNAHWFSNIQCIDWVYENSIPNPLVMVAGV